MKYAISTLIFIISFSFSGLVISTTHSPFHINTFANWGWKGKVKWSKPDKVEESKPWKKVVEWTTPYKDIVLDVIGRRVISEATKKHIFRLNIRTGIGQNIGCVGLMDETHRSPDGLTIYMSPYENSGCDDGVTKVTLTVIDALKIHIDIYKGSKIIAKGTLHATKRKQALAYKSFKQKKEPPLYVSRNLVISPDYRGETLQQPKQEWCANDTPKRGHKFNAKYDVSHKSRSRLFDHDYEKFIETKLLPAIVKFCGRKTTYIQIRMYKKGENKTWDIIIFHLKNGKVVKSYQQPKALLSQYKKPGPNPDELQSLKKQGIWGYVCDGPFCELPGGFYLNAIYNNDIFMLGFLDKGIDRITDNKAPLIIGLTDVYMHDYKYYRTGNCLKKNSKSKTYTFKTKPTQWQTLSGMYAGTTPGISKAAVYNVNADFYPLVLKIGNSRGGSGWKGAYGMYKRLEAASLTLDGLVGLRRRYHCDSPEVKQFERNLINLAERYLKDPEGTKNKILY